MISGIVYHKVFKVILAISSTVFVIYAIKIFGYSLQYCFECPQDISSVTMIDVGQGDGYLVELRSGQRVLIDTGNSSEKIVRGIKKSAQTPDQFFQEQSPAPAKDSSLLQSIGKSIVNFAESLVTLSRTTLDLVIITHDDADHVGVLDSILQQVDVGAVVSSPFQHTYIDAIFSPTDERSIDAHQSSLESKMNTSQKTKTFTEVHRIRSATKGMKMVFQDHHMTGRHDEPKDYIHILYPNLLVSSMTSSSKIPVVMPVSSTSVSVLTSSTPSPTPVPAQKNSTPKVDQRDTTDTTSRRAGNADSLIFVFSISNTSILFTGDAGIAEEKMLITQQKRDESSDGEEALIKNKNIDKNIDTELTSVDILKVGHHGSKTSTSPEFIDYLRPTYALISSGYKNRYGHPHISVLRTLKKYIQEDYIIRSDQCGTYTLYIYKNDVIRRRLCQSH